MGTNYVNKSPHKKKQHMLHVWELITLKKHVLCIRTSRFPSATWMKGYVGVYIIRPTVRVKLFCMSLPIWLFALPGSLYKVLSWIVCLNAILSYSKHCEYLSLSIINMGEHYSFRIVIQTVLFWRSSASGLSIQCLFKRVCPNTKGKSTIKDR